MIDEEHIVSVKLVYDDAIWLRAFLMHLNAFLTGDMNKFKTWNESVEALRLLSDKCDRVNRIVDALTHTH